MKNITVNTYNTPKHIQEEIDLCVNVANSFVDTIIICTATDEEIKQFIEVLSDLKRDIEQYKEYILSVFINEGMNGTLYFDDFEKAIYYFE